jgi:hypothetical protein
VIVTDAAEIYCQMFKAALAQPPVTATVKLAFAWAALKHPAVAYGLGATALGIGLPTAYALGKDRGLSQSRALTSPASLPPVYPDAGQAPSAWTLPIPGLGYSPEGFDDAYNFDPYTEPEYDYGADPYGWNDGWGY